MLEPECTGDKLYEQVCSMLAHPTQLGEMSRNLARLSVTDANERIYQVLKGLMK